MIVLKKQPDIVATMHFFVNFFKKGKKIVKIVTSRGNSGNSGGDGGWDGVLNSNHRGMGRGKTARELGGTSSLGSLWHPYVFYS
mgnify:CR=1 FL=1